MFYRNDLKIKTLFVLLFVFFLNTACSNCQNIKSIAIQYRDFDSRINFAIYNDSLHLITCITSGSKVVNSFEYVYTNTLDSLEKRITHQKKVWPPSIEYSKVELLYEYDTYDKVIIKIKNEYKFFRGRGSWPKGSIYIHFTGTPKKYNIEVTNGIEDYAIFDNKLFILEFNGPVYVLDFSKMKKD
jgi:hypothetical protein